MPAKRQQDGTKLVEDLLENPGAAKTSVRAIAQRLGVSPATVSLALNGRRPTGFVSMATRKQVREAAQEMGYSLDRLRAQRPLLDRVGIFMLAGPNPVYSETVLHLCRALNVSGIQALTYLTRSDQESYTVVRDLVHRHEIDGAVFVGSRDEMPSLDIPCVFVGEVPAGQPVWQVRADNEAGGRAVGEYLWSLGHRSVAMIAPVRTNSAGERRLQGLRAFWTEQGAEMPDSHVLRVIPEQNAEEQVRTVVTRFLEENRQTAVPTTAFFCFNDWLAGAVLKVLRGLGVRLPAEVSVVGFDDSLYAELLDPALTTVHNPFDVLGTQAAALLLEQVETPEAAPRIAVTPCRLVERQSCAPAPETAIH